MRVPEQSEQADVRIDSTMRSRFGDGLRWAIAFSIVRKLFLVSVKRVLF